MSWSSLDPTLRIRIGVGFVQRFLAIMLMPLMVIYLTGLYGIATAGVLSLIVAAAAIVSNFVGGHLADIHGRRPLFLFGEVGALVTFVGLTVAVSPWWDSGVAVFGFFLLNQVVCNVAIPAGESMLIDASSPENRKLVYTINYWSINLAFTGGALTGGFLYGNFFMWLLAGSAVLCLVTLIISWIWLTETMPQITEAARRGILGMVRGYVEVARDTVFLRLMLAAVLTRAIEVQIGYYIAVRLAEEFPRQTLVSWGEWKAAIGGVEMLGILRAVNTVLIVVLALFAGVLFGKLSDRWRLYGGITLFTAGYMVWAVSNSGWLLIVAAVVLTIGEISNVPIKQVLLADLVDPNARTKYLAAYGLNARIGLLIGSGCVILGAFVPSYTMAILYGLCGIGAIAFYRSLLRIREQRAARESNLVAT
ncbi:MFS transporter [Natronoglycomyces albus]|uniref:MFS transporter n=1 Tax=Natronoglycomyces albus TaxID=2811108 RepID=A0A895XQK7_9ACTN|nr:MFS transporter [Natronoglycomyces albus]QSB04846.1 MFS transporter [Natronoglycomyces albus]